MLKQTNKLMEGLKIVDYQLKNEKGGANQKYPLDKPVVKPHNVNSIY